MLCCVWLVCMCVRRSVHPVGPVTEEEGKCVGTARLEFCDRMGPKTKENDIPRLRTELTCAGGKCTVHVVAAVPAVFVPLFIDKTKKFVVIVLVVFLVRHHGSSKKITGIATPPTE